MAIDAQRVGAMALEFMESLEQRFGEEATLEPVAFIAVVDTGDGADTTWQFRHGDGSAVRLRVARGMLAETDRGLTADRPS